MAEKCQNCGMPYESVYRAESRRWIPVSERLPDEPGTYQCISGGGWYPRARFLSSGRWEDPDYKPGVNRGQLFPTYWQPLPPLPDDPS